MTDRYIVRELTGYTLSVDTQRPRGNVLETSDVMVLDTWYNHAVEAYWSGEGRGANNGRNHIFVRRIKARRLCDELNAEHEAAMLAPMQAGDTAEAAQARKGTAS